MLTSGARHPENPRASSHHGGLLGRLRRVTAPAHQELERHLLLRPLLRPDLSCAAYVRVLGAFADFHGELEPRLMSALHAFSPLRDDSSHYRYLSRLSLLRRDLADLDAATARGDAPLPSLPALQTPEALLGVLYVLEGATQGGRVIAPRLRNTLGLGRFFGAHYFHLHEAGQWSRFKRLLANAAEATDPDAVAASATDTFATLGNFLDRAHNPSDRS